MTLGSISALLESLRSLVEAAVSSSRFAGTKRGIRDAARSRSSPEEKAKELFGGLMQTFMIQMKKEQPSDSAIIAAIAWARGQINAYEDKEDQAKIRSLLKSSILPKDNVKALFKKTGKSALDALKELVR